MAQPVSGIRESARAIGLWLGAAVLGSFGTVAAFVLIQGERWDRMAAEFAAGTLPFTVVGSGLLVLAFAWMGGRSFPVLARYVALILLGAVAGALMLAPLGVTGEGVRLGSAFGFGTACAWVSLHLFIYRGR